MAKEPNPTEAKIQTNQDSRPTPDPTILTTQMVLREIASMREILESRIHCSEELIEHLQKLLDQRQAAVVAEVGHLQKLHEEKFNSIQIQFSEKNNKTEKIAELNQRAIDAALQAAKEAVEKQNTSNKEANGKSETAFTKQVDSMVTQYSTMNRALEDKIGDLRERLNGVNLNTTTYAATGEGRSKGISDGWGWIVGAVGLIAGVVSMIIMVMKALDK